MGHWFAYLHLLSASNSVWNILDANMIFHKGKNGWKEGKKEEGKNDWEKERKKKGKGEGE